jgi:hypothetical protein
VLTTQDGGRTWTAIRGRQALPPSDGQLLPTREGIVIDQLGHLRLIEEGALGQVVEIESPFRATCLEFVDSSRVVLGGEQGMVRWSNTAAKSWTQPIRDTSTLSNIDMATVCAHGSSCWMAGNPGTHVLHLGDFGRSWNLCATGQALPIHALSFVDARHGWAVGAFGTILHTSDGGRSWAAQRGGRRRAVVMAVYSDHHQVPWMRLAELSAADGYRTVVCTIGRHAGGELEHAPYEWRMREAANAIASTFAGTLTSLDIHDSQFAGDALSMAIDGRQALDSQVLLRAIRRLATEIRTWKPDIILLRSAGPDEQTVDRLILDLANEAIRKAAESSPTAPSGAPEPWKVQRIVMESSSEAAQHRSDPIALTLGFSASELATCALSHFVERPSLDHVNRALFVAGAEGKPVKMERIESLFTASARDEPARRSRSLGDQDVRRLQQQAQRRRNVMSLWQRSKSDQRFGIEQLVQLTHDMELDEKGEMLFWMASQAERASDYESLEGILRHLTFDLADHPCAEAAAIWLAQLETSAEIELARSSRQRQVERPHLAMTVHAATALVGAGENEASQRVQVVDRIQRLRPSLFFEPRVQFSLAALWRRLGESQAMNLYSRQASTQADIWWRHCATAEMSLAKPRHEQLFTRPIIDCVSTPERPHLDGDLSEECWRKAPSAELVTRVGSPGESAFVQFSHDEQFLFIGIRCPRVLDDGSALPRTAATRDADMSQRDRVEIFFDVDRDYSTFWRLVLDDLGRGADSVGLNASWNPIWYFAARDGDTEWNVEAARHLDELTQEPINGATWLIGLQRKVPGHRFQAWNQRYGIDGWPLGFGLLRY